MKLQSKDFVLEGTNDRIGYFMNIWVSPMSREEGYVLVRMQDVLALRMPWKRKLDTTRRRLQAELDRVIFTSSEAEWRWTSDKNSKKPTPRQAHPKASITYNGPIGAPPARTRKARPFSKKAQFGRVAKVLKAPRLLVAEEVRHPVQKTVTVADIGFGPGGQEGGYDMLYLSRNPNKMATEKLMAHIEKECIECRQHKQRMLITRHTVSVKS